MKKDRIIALTKTAMRLTFLYALITSIVVFSTHAKEADAQGVLDKRIELSAKRVTIKQMIASLENQSGAHFIYSSSAIKADRKIKTADLYGDLSDVLNQVFRPLGIGYKIENEKVLLFSVFQDITIAGKVTDAANNGPIVGAAVKVKGTDRGTSTNDDGQFSLTVQPKEVVEVSYVGYVPQEFVVDNNQHVYEIALQPSLSTLDEVVVTGYSAQRVKDLTGSVAVVSIKDLKQQPAASPIEALQGKATGVQIINDGAPGATPQIRIRGFSTINNNDPLYVIDGMPYEGKLGWLNANDIESMQVLKDASAASIYGARANNGVVIITTRKGQKGAPKITFDAYYGTQSPQRNRFPEFLNPQQFAEYVYQRFKNTGDPAQAPGMSETTGTNYGSDPDNPVLPDYLLAGTTTGHNITEADADPAKYNYAMDPAQFYQITRANKTGTNWFDAITQNAPMQNYQLSILGGGENSTYAISGGAFKQEGTYKYTGFERYTIRSNTTFSFLDDRVTIGENMQYSHTRGNGFGVNVNRAGDYQGEGSPIGWAYRIQTIVPVYDIMGNFAGTRGDKMGNADNPLSVLYRAKDNSNNSGQFFGSTFADIKLAKGLSFRTTFGLRYENYHSKSIGYPNPERSEGSFTNNTLQEPQGYNSEWTWTNTATYKNVFNDAHDLTLLVGTEAVESNWHETRGYGNDFFIAGDLNYYYLNTAATTRAESEGSEGSLFSIFGRADYAFKDRYLVSATLRRDGSSAFGPDNRYGLFPAASVAWRLSSENFMATAAWMDDLKLRAGYGTTGNQRIPTFQYLRRYASGVNQSFYPIAGGNDLSSGLWTNNYDNPSVKWEELKSINVGLDFTLFNRTIDGAIDWFDRRTSGVLYPVPQPSAAVGTGSSPFVNSGDIKNAGFEVSLNYHYFSPSGDDDAFQFDAGVFFSRYTNDIVELAPSVTEQPYLTLRGVTTSVLKAGAPLGAFYGYQVAGIYQDDADIANSASYENARIGGFKFADISGPDGTPDGVIDGNDRTVIGNPHPDFIYSVSLGASYKRFDINMFFNGSQGNELFDLTRQYTDFYAFPGAVSTRTLNAWSPSNPNSMMPSPHAKAPTIEYQSSSYYVQDGSFFRMRNLQLGYTLPADRMFQGKVSNLRVYASVTNLFTVTGYSGMDPEVSQYSSDFTAPGVDMGVYPVPRQYLLGLSVTF
ncbi:TonB-linked outer membrane protein, SusC/RagA family [Parapedobacter indicus]|uniref:TonB-linked outer membrane protein, SusC/RagA family n=2 Tax=Parapedobacter indicus TaxID=1477437 RepID=A0A1I3J9R1_9SPHI|nr:TonB-linked SusC/RagA family outer membrane protein [Parapedobacter indicus]SFI56959.1 TonB-linked outer membrane protein, SusC/RagA family [Parapedobacter indicus]